MITNDDDDDDDNNNNNNNNNCLGTSKICEFQTSVSLPIRKHQTSSTAFGETDCNEWQTCLDVRYKNSMPQSY